MTKVNDSFKNVFNVKHCKKMSASTVEEISEFFESGEEVDLEVTIDFDFSSEADNNSMAGYARDILLSPDLLDNLSSEQFYFLALALNKMYNLGRAAGGIEGARFAVNHIAKNGGLKNESQEEIFQLLASKHGARKNLESRNLALAFLSELFEENPNISIKKMAEILEVESTNNPDKFKCTKGIPFETGRGYARLIKNKES